MSGRPNFMYEQKQQNQANKGRSTNNFSQIIRKTEMNLLGLSQKSNPFSGLKQQMSSSIDFSAIDSSQNQLNSSMVSIQDLQRRDEEMRRYIQKQIQEGLEKSMLECRNEINDGLSKSFYSQQNQNEISQIQSQNQQETNKFVDVVQEIQKDYNLMKQKITEIQQSFSTKELDKIRKQKEKEIDQLDYSQINEKIQFLENQIVSSKDQFNETIQQISKDKQQQSNEQNDNLQKINLNHQYQEEMHKLIAQTKGELLEKMKNLEESFVNQSRMNTQENFFISDQSMIAPNQSEIQSLKIDLQNTQYEINSKLMSVSSKIDEQFKLKEKQLEEQYSKSQIEKNEKIRKLEDQLQQQQQKMQELQSKLEVTQEKPEKYDKIVSLEKNLTKIENQLQNFLSSFEDSKTPNQNQYQKQQDIDQFAEQYKYLQQLRQSEQYQYAQQQQQQNNQYYSEQSQPLEQQQQVQDNIQVQNQENNNINQYLSPIVEQTNESSGQKSLSITKEKEDSMLNLKNLLKNIKNEEDSQKKVNPSSSLQNLKTQQNNVEQEGLEESPQIPTQLRYNSEQKINPSYESENIFNYSSSKNLENSQQQQQSQYEPQRQQIQAEQKEEEKSFQERLYESQRRQVEQQQPEQFLYIKNTQQQQTLDDGNISRSIDFFNIEEKNKNQQFRDDASVNYSYSSFIENENFNDFLGQTGKVSFAQYAQQIEKQLQEQQRIDINKEEQQQQLINVHKQSGNEYPSSQQTSEGVQFQFDFQSAADHQSLYPKNISIQNQNQFEYHQQSTLELQLNNQITQSQLNKQITESQYNAFAQDPFAQMEQSNIQIQQSLEISNTKQSNQKNNLSPTNNNVDENNCDEEMAIGNEDEFELSSIQMPNQSFTIFSKSKVELDEKYLSQYQQQMQLQQQKNNVHQQQQINNNDNIILQQEVLQQYNENNNQEQEELKVIQISEQFDPSNLDNINQNFQNQVQNQNLSPQKQFNQQSPKKQTNTSPQKILQLSPPKMQSNFKDETQQLQHPQVLVQQQQQPLSMFNMASYSTVDQQLEMIHKQQSQQSQDSFQNLNNNNNNNNDSFLNTYQQQIQNIIVTQEDQANQQQDYQQKNNLWNLSEQNQQAIQNPIQNMNFSEQINEPTQSCNNENSEIVNQNVYNNDAQKYKEKENDQSSNIPNEQTQEFSQNLQEKVSNDEEIVYQLDEDGHLIDDNGNYILDDNGQVIKLTSEHIEYLKGEKMLVEEFQQQQQQQQQQSQEQQIQ